MTSRFHGPLRVELTGENRRGRPVWVVLQDLRFDYRAPNDITVTVVAERGFKTDFASVPRFFWRIVPPGGAYAAAAVIHDWLYARRIGSRKLADQIFAEAMKSVGIPAWRRSIMFRAVRTFGGGGWGR